MEYYIQINNEERATEPELRSVLEEITTQYNQRKTYTRDLVVEEVKNKVNQVGMIVIEFPQTVNHWKIKIYQVGKEHNWPVLNIEFTPIWGWAVTE